MTSDRREMIARMSGDELPGDEAQAAIGFADDSLLDPVDRVRGLAHLDVLRERVERAAVARARDLGAHPRTSAQAHLLDFGHRLTFGCCGPYASSAERAAA